MFHQCPFQGLMFVTRAPFQCKDGILPYIAVMGNSMLKERRPIGRLFFEHGVAFTDLTISLYCQYKGTVPPVWATPCLKKRRPIGRLFNSILKEIGRPIGLWIIWIRIILGYFAQNCILLFWVHTPTSVAIYPLIFELHTFEFSQGFNKSPFKRTF